MDYLAGFSSHYQRAHCVYVAGLSCSVSVISYSIRKGEKKKYVIGNYGYL